MSDARNPHPFIISTQVVQQPKPQDDPQSFPECSPVDIRTPPAFVLPIRRPILLSTFSAQAPSVSGVVAKPFKLGSISFHAVNAHLAFDCRYEQTWNLTTVGIGDLSSTIGLAPAEQLTLEFKTTQRKKMDRTVLDSVENIDSSESTTSDKEAVNVARASSQTQNWHVDATGTLTSGFATLSVSAGYSKSVTESSQQSVNHVTESTKKSAHSLKALHKIEVHGTTENVVQNRMTRLIKNPYPDRTMAVNVFQLVKHFSVRTGLAETRLALVIDMEPLPFDANFIASNVDFLSATLLDSSLTDGLATAIKAAEGQLTTKSRSMARLVAQRALFDLYDKPNIFHVETLDGENANLPTSSFNASWSDSGLSDAIDNQFASIFVVLNFFYAVYKDTVYQQGDDADHLIRLAVALSSNVGEQWKTLKEDGKMDNILDDSDFTEILRRALGFVAMVEGILKPLLEPAAQEQTATNDLIAADAVYQRLMQHLSDNTAYYTEEYLYYLSRKTRGVGPADFARQVLAQVANIYSELPPTLDLDRTFVCGNKIVVPGLVALTSADMLNIGIHYFNDKTPVALPVDTVEDIDVPADGIHLEVAPGNCVLPYVPANPFSGSFKLGNLDLEVQGSASSN